MLPDATELRKQFNKKSTDELLTILRHSQNYRKEAIQIIEEELHARGASQEEVKDYILKKSDYQQVNAQNAIAELTAIQKAAVFFLWFVPFLISAYETNWKEDGMIRKVRQSRYFKMCSVVSIVISIAVSFFIPGSVKITIIFPLLFLLSLYLEKYFTNLIYNAK